MAAITQESVTANGVDFAVLCAGIGGDSAPLALCLHGFPDSAHSWRHLLPELAGAGYRAIAPFQRGYAPTSIPADGLYQSGVLATDANALHEELGGDERAVIIGHDWGASAAHGASVLDPGRWCKVVSMAVPPGPALAMALLTSPAQLKLSWYMFFFQSPLADLVVPANDLAFIDMLWADWSPGFDATADLARVKAALGNPANLTAALGYYRATLGDGLKDPALDPAQAATQVFPSQPMLYIHGREDGCIGVAVADVAAAMAPANVTCRVVDGAGHFLHVERPKLVNALIMDFLS